MEGAEKAGRLISAASPSQMQENTCSRPHLITHELHHILARPHGGLGKKECKSLLLSVRPQAPQPKAWQGLRHVKPWLWASETAPQIPCLPTGLGPHLGLGHARGQKERNVHPYNKNRAGIPRTEQTFRPQGLVSITQELNQALRPFVLWL